MILGVNRDNGKEHGSYRDYRVSIGFIMGYIYIYQGYIGILEKKMEATVWVFFRDYIVVRKDITAVQQRMP